MATKTGAIGNNDPNNFRTYFKTPQALGIQMATGEYPNGSITMTDIVSGGPIWRNEHAGRMAFDVRLYLCDSAGNNKALIGTWNIAAAQSSTKKDFSVSGATGLAGKALYLIMDDTWAEPGDSRDFTVLRYRTGVSVQTAYNQFSVTCQSGGNGSLTASANSAVVGSTVTLYPSANTGYYLTGYTSSPSVTITNNTFTMPASAVTITANFAKVTYSITKSASPAAGGTVTAAGTAQMGDSVSVSQTPNAGYYFNGWTTSPALTISGGAFTMPASNVSITANYLKRSTGSLSKTSMTGGDTITLTISADKTSYSHKYKLSFGTNMETSLTNVNAGVSSVSISVPASWSNYIPSATSKGSGTLTLYTYNGSTQIGSYTISSLTYNVPASAVPSVGTVTTSIARTIGGTTYANVGNYYVQNHSGVRVQTTASGSYSSTISSLKVSLNGYSGNNYNKTVSSSSIDFTTGLLSVSGSTTITVTATDSRGRTATKTATITVTAYNAPGGTVTCRRVNSGGSDDDMGEYAKYTLTKNYTAVGSNSLTVRMTSQGSTVTISNTTGDVLPGSRQTFSIQQEYTVTVTLQDSFETTTVTGKVRSANFLIYASANGKKLGFKKAATKGGTNDETIEFSGTATIYIGDLTLAQYIQSIVNNM